MEHTILSARQLNLYYGENHALKDICIQIPEHQITALIGPCLLYTSDAADE